MCIHRTFGLFVNNQPNKFCQRKTISFFHLNKYFFLTIPSSLFFFFVKSIWLHFCGVFFFAFHKLGFRKCIKYVNILFLTTIYLDLIFSSIFFVCVLFCFVLYYIICVLNFVCIFKINKTFFSKVVAFVIVCGWVGFVFVFICLLLLLLF